MVVAPHYGHKDHGTELTEPAGQCWCDKRVTSSADRQKRSLARAIDDGQTAKKTIFRRSPARGIHIAKYVDLGRESNRRFLSGAPVS